MSFLLENEIAFKTSKWHSERFTFMSFLLGNQIAFKTYKWHCNWEILCSFRRYQKRQNQDTPYGAREGNYSSIWCAEGTSSNHLQRLVSVYQNLRQKCSLCPTLNILSFLSHRVGCKTVRKECKNFTLFVPGVGTICYGLSLGLMQLNRIIFTTTFSIWFCVWRVKAFFCLITQKKCADFFSFCLFFNLELLWSKAEKTDKCTEDALHTGSEGYKTWNKSLAKDYFKQIVHSRYGWVKRGCLWRGMHVTPILGPNLHKSTLEEMLPASQGNWYSHVVQKDRCQIFGGKMFPRHK